MRRHQEVSVAVIGSANVDLVMEAASLPLPGETVLGRAISRHAGGKGVNQAVAAAAQVSTYFIGSVGADEGASLVRDRLDRAGVLFRGFIVDAHTSGFAVVVVGDSGENQIVVVPGANSALRTPEVLRAVKRIRPGVIALQLEIPWDVVQAVSDWAMKRGVRVVLNASPLSPDLDEGLVQTLIASSDPLIVNVSEARALARVGFEVGARELARALSLRTRSTIVTDGGRGAFVARAGTEVHHVPAVRNQVVDTTGAGDSFAGTVAGKLALGYPLLDAACAAADVAGRLVGRSRADRVDAVSV